MMEAHRKILIYVGVVPVIPCATRRQTQKIEGEQLILSSGQWRGEIVGLILKWLTENQGWLLWLWWEYSKLLLSSLQGKLGLLQAEEALDGILNRPREPLPNGLWSSQHVVGCCWKQFLATVAVFMKKRFKKVSIKGVVGWEVKFPGAKSNGAFMFTNFGVRSWKSLLAWCRGSRQTSNKVPITCP